MANNQFIHCFCYTNEIVIYSTVDDANGESALIRISSSSTCSNAVDASFITTLRNSYYLEKKKLIFFRMNLNAGIRQNCISIRLSLHSLFNAIVLRRTCAFSHSLHDGHHFLR